MNPKLLITLAAATLPFAAAPNPIQEWTVPWENTRPRDPYVAPDRMVWFTGNQNARLMKLDPKTRKLTNYPMPDPKIQDPHTMTFDKAGNIWFTAQNAAVIGRRDAKSGQIRVPTTTRERSGWRRRV
jgi:virginiamycin B lyase